MPREPKVRPLTESKVSPLREETVNDDPALEQAIHEVAARARDEELRGVEAVTFSEPFEMPEPIEYRKVASTLAVKIPIAFEVRTKEGTMQGKPGDYLCGPGAAGEFWPVDADVFEATYEPIDTQREEPTRYNARDEEIVEDELDRKLREGEKGQVWTQ